MKKMVIYLLLALLCLLPCTTALAAETGSENITGFPFGPEHNILPA